MTQYYIYKHLPSETHDMLDGARVVCFENLDFELGHEKAVGEGPFVSIKELKANSLIYKQLLTDDKKRAEKILFDKFIVKATPRPIIFPTGLNPEYEKIIYRIMQHSSNGTITRKNVQGVHLFNPQKNRITNLISPQNSQGVFIAEIEVLSNRTNKWVRKESETTFFPTNWNKQRLIIECYYAFINREKQTETEFIGKTKSGIKVLFLYSKEGEFKTIYPIYE